MNRQERTHRVALAALLHDVGKVAQRALEQAPLEDLQEFARSEDGGIHYGYVHAALTAAFLTRRLEPLWRGEGTDNPLTLASRHHRPSTPLDWVVAESDRLSSGMDRPQEAEPARAGEVPLESVLARVRAEKAPPAARFWSLNEFSLDREVLFPTVRPSVDASRYRSLYQLLCAGADAIVEGLERLDPPKPLPWLVVAVQALLERVAWAVPAATNVKPSDISLYDHARSAAAIAACIAFHEESERDDGFVRNREDERYALVCLDISGIQTYLHALKSDGARRSLTGRSFYVQLLQDALATQCLERCGLPAVNCIYQGGGKVWLLLPKAVVADVRAWVGQVDYAVSRETGGLLGVSCGVSCFSGKDLAQKHIGPHWKSALDDLRASRLHRMRDFARAHYDEVFAPVQAGRYACEQCTQETSSQEGSCDHCRLAERIGRHLGRQPYVLREPTDAPWSIQTPVGPRYALQDPTDCASKAGGQVILCTKLVTFEEFLALLRAGCAPVFWPVAASGPVEFERLAERNPGAARLGVLRGDVDNLGDLFQEGFSRDQQSLSRQEGSPRDQQSLSRMASLSRALRDFFGAYLPAAIAARWPEEIRIVFSGGDDFFIVGSFHRVPEVADFIRREFQAFGGGNPHLTLSAGIAVQRAHAPLHVTARRALDAEQAAKGFVRRGATGAEVRKDAVCLFDEPLSWPELSRAGALAATLIRAVQRPSDRDAGSTPFSWSGLPDAPDEPLPRSVFQVLGTIASLYRAARRPGHGLAALQRAINSERYRWIAAYSLTRLAREKAFASSFLEFLKHEVTNPKPTGGDVRPLNDYLPVAVQWAFLLTKPEQ